MTATDLVPRATLQTRDDGTIVDRITGEAVVLRELPADQLAVAQARLIELVENLADVDRLVKAELLRRMDASATWTARYGDPSTGQQIEVTASSPSAGTEAYEADVLERLLEPLVEEGVLAPELLDQVVKRTVTVRAEGRGDDVRKLERYARTRGYELTVSTSVAIGGVRKLEKLKRPDVLEAIAAARADKAAPKRTPKVKVLDVDRERRR